METKRTSTPRPGSASGDEFETVRRLLYDHTGISLGDNKWDMVRGRLARRLRHHRLATVAEYLQLLEAAGPDSDEMQEFVNCLTTNKTDFFREAHHFTFLRDTVIPALKARGVRRVRVWSAGCSTGEEPYTLAMTLRECCPPSEGWDVKILASDIDTAVLAAAERGVFDATKADAVPPELLKKYFLRGTGTNAEKVAIRPELRDMLSFRRINLMDDPWPIRTQFDAIFCRNVVIYFDRPTQRRLFERFVRQLDPSGYLLVGHSENLHWMADMLAPVGNTVYRPRGSANTPPPARRLTKPASTKLEGEEHSIILGEVKAVRGPAVIKTLLGSCVAACIYDPQVGVGGMNHFSLPGASEAGVSARYGAHAMELLITAVMKAGGDRSRLRAKVFGGGRVLNVASERLNIGSRNAAFVLEYLEAEGIPVEAQCLGGDRGMIVRFQTHTGVAQAKPLAERELTGVVRNEEAFNQQLMGRVKAPADDRITLF